MILILLVMVVDSWGELWPNVRCVLHDVRRGFRLNLHTSDER